MANTIIVFFLLILKNNNSAQNFGKHQSTCPRKLLALATINLNFCSDKQANKFSQERSKLLQPTNSTLLINLVNDVPG